MPRVPWPCQSLVPTALARHARAPTLAWRGHGLSAADRAQRSKSCLPVMRPNRSC
ncbi:hypothetical protein BCR44DRAFT_1438999 [Catenaria anguillulae PL171]|uniref:Uncharacterized protein n=1 Tax=Catenaria anguillulae PL171 TaxID=765915 RepID=A0A1Y2HH81_9FUNG|nr:hypothetical protein BCR44DRAFT_1438999 [Catenaria anguillulae PL171]